MTNYETEKARVNSWNQTRDQFLKDKAKAEGKVIPASLTKVPQSEVNKVKIK